MNIITSLIESYCTAVKVGNLLGLNRQERRYLNKNGENSTRHVSKSGSEKVSGFGTRLHEERNKLLWKHWLNVWSLGSVLFLDTCRIKTFPFHNSAPSTTQQLMDTNQSVYRNSDFKIYVDFYHCNTFRKHKTNSNKIPIKMLDIINPKLHGQLSYLPSYFLDS